MTNEPTTGTDRPIVTIIRSFADEHDERYAQRIHALAHRVDQELTAFEDFAAGEHIALGEDWMTLMRAVDRLNERLLVQEQVIAAQQIAITALQAQPPVMVDLVTWRHEVISECQRAVAEAWNLHDDRIVALERRARCAGDSSNAA
jgi:hypothetical protein